MRTRRTSFRAALTALCAAAALAADTSAPPAPPGQPVFVTVPERFRELSRPPVLFQHDRHTAALRAEGCEACHASREGRLQFGFPREPDERSRTAWMNAQHDACLGCHTRTAKTGAKSGPVDCGVCHDPRKAYQPRERRPVTPEHYNALRDPYHRDCLACHASDAAEEKHAGPLDWHRFYVTEKRQVELDWPEAVFDYVMHDRHQTTLEKRCELCHYLPPDVQQRLAAEGKEPTSQDWLRVEEPGKSWEGRAQAHERCIRCHLDRAAKRLAAGPVECAGCHARPMPTAELLAKTPPPDYGGKERILILATNATAAAVPFNHKAHIGRSRSCSDCHHRTLDACSSCHPAQGIREGGFVTLAEAYHDADSTWSCVGCHARRTAQPDCAGCHHLRPAGLTASSCAACHAGSLDALDRVAKLPDPATLLPKDTKEEFSLGILAADYKPSRFPHLKIVRKLTEISSASTLASRFHAGETALCAGCHHLGAVEKGRPVPACGSCHTVRPEPTRAVPALLGAYHQQCLGCHQQMGGPEKQMPRSCEGCHEVAKRK
jgi:hypothetical protein